MTTRFITARWPLVAAVTAVALALFAACTGGGDGDGADGGTPAAGAVVTPVLVNSELVVGENRFMVGLISAENEEIVGADVSFSFFKLDGEERDPRGEAEATPVVLEKSYTETHEDGTVQTHSAGESGIYVARVSFDEAATWAAEVTVRVDGTSYEPAVLSFSVVDTGGTAAVGAPAPRSETLTLDDVDDVAQIDTSDPPIPEMHTMTIAEAVTSGRPSVIVFATPANCASRFCGPVKDVVDALFEEYGDDVNFVHVEPYDVPRVRESDCNSLFECRVAAVDEWGLRSEPWVFLVDSDGDVAAKFEAVVTLEELRAALISLMGSASSDTSRY